uniref:Cytochrome P450 n=1 Tax=Bracon brevicornis TaxID=1563983 RepID=A0A6V7M137_9HYME
MDTWTILLTFAALIGSLYYWLTRKNYFEKHGIIHKKPLPFLGNSAGVIFRTQSFADYVQEVYDLHKEAKYVGFYDFEVPVIMIRDPELIKTITVKHFDHFVDHRTFVDVDMDPFFGGNLFALKGKKWREMRNLLSPAFTSSKMRGMFKLMSNCAENFADYFASEAGNKELEVNSKDIFTRYTSDVIGTCAFGVAVDSMRNPNNDFYILGRKATTFTGFVFLKFFIVRRFPALAKLLGLKLIDQKVQDFFNELIKNTVETRDREGITRPDMIQLMMEARNNKSGEGPNLTIQEMTAQAFIFFFGGFDTTSALMCFVAHLIALYPEVQEKLQQEVDEVYEKCQENVTYEAINDMPYLEAVLYEAMRVYPIGPGLDRVCTQSFELPPALPGKKPIVLQPGDCFSLPVYPLHRSSEYFPDAEKFYPERFIEDPKGTLHNPAFMPFGIGPRMCIGNRFALLETKVLIFHLIAKCSLEIGNKMTLPLKLCTKTFAMTAAGGFWLRLTPRNKWQIKNSKLD